MVSGFCFLVTESGFLGCSLLWLRVVLKVDGFSVTSPKSGGESQLHHKHVGISVPSPWPPPDVQEASHFCLSEGGT